MFSFVVVVVVGCPWLIYYMVVVIFCFFFIYLFQLFVACEWNSDGRVELICGSLLREANFSNSNSIYS